ncbi:hypothetical protein [Oligosphaera ethanolica]|uniref:Uncharacterized protein n=1 Tax=Oligosphaera ethanolica TaxID=760260 RepID=A0AAE3VI12_9BACT|nr:hypothetical protein [Oligosphaera ethanolica]MDQ0291067.1 hypothetical protein [Oligosphaera ethanolica]
MRSIRINKQRGSALLLTLGILSLVLIMAMSFAFSARTRRQVAKVNADQIKARLLAESALERVKAAMKLNFTNAYPPIERQAANYPDDGNGFVFTYHQDTIVTPSWRQDYLVSKQGSGTISAQDLANLDKFLGLGHFNKALPITEHIDSDLPTQRGYQDISSGGEIIGRIAFLVIEDANKLDVNQIVSLNSRVPFIITGQEVLAPFYSTDTAYEHFFYDICGDGTYATMNFSGGSFEQETVRLGLQMQEIRADYRYYSALPSGFSSTKAQWFSYLHLWNCLGHADTSKGAYDPSAIFATDVFKYTFFSGDDIEAYWDGSTELQRFDITGFEWRSSSALDFYIPDPTDTSTPPTRYIVNPLQSGWHHGGTLTGAQGLVDTLVSSGSSPDISDLSLHATMIPYLNSIVDTSGASLAHQVAANMVDFCDSDSFATTDATWAGAVPTYCGNERVAYGNEVKLSFKIIKVPSVDGTKFHFKIDVDSDCEMINIYPSAPTDASGVYKLILRGNIQIGSSPLVPIPETAWQKVVSSGDFSAGSTYFSIPVSSSSVTIYEDDTVEYASDPNVDISFTDISFVLLYGQSITVDNEQIFDVAYAEKDTLILCTSSSVGFPSMGYSSYIYAEVSDPRCNNNPNSVNWTWLVSTTNKSLGQKNSLNTTPSGSDYDYEDYANIDFSTADKTFSTAFIANRPFRSLWELGAIHRGEPFQTLNLTAFSASGGTYAAGDAAILDQVKIGPLKKTKGKFNANSTNPSAFVELLKGISISDPYDGSCSYSTSGYLVPVTLDNTVSENRGVFASRIPSSGLYTTEPANDREREALIGRTANLLTTRVDKYSVLVVGQALKELEGVTDATWAQVQQTAINPIEYPSGSKNYYSRLGTQRILAHIVRDAWRNEYKVVQMQLLED